MKDESGAFAQTISAAIKQGIELVIVHGGGPQIDAALLSAGIQSQSIGGFRVTTPEIFEIVQSVLAGEVCASVVSNLRKAGVNAAMKNDFKGGMAPKVAACLAAIAAGATAVRIIDGNSAENLLLALAGNGGTLVHA
jgi:acetylglutamate kinase